ncbi:MAG TPA: biotin/lipoate A/B protein ligase family protein [Anaerolineae bacterium]|nr:biotin/lipoate A/B protein ligase family protein [Anaerolineae bacterium]
MAIDEAILRGVADGSAPPTLRFFAWQPACLSLGQAQPFADVDVEACRALGVEVVRRPTGGRAILHVDELTYSVTAPETEARVQGGIVESYRRLSEGLLAGLLRIGIPVQQVERPESHDRDQGPVCFEAPSNYEIVFDGHKLVGSAQMRKNGVMLQHGSLPLVGDIARICSVLQSRPDPERVRARAITIARAVGCVVPYPEAAQQLAEGFKAALNLKLEPGDLTAQERDWAEKLRREKYASDAWTRRI